MCSLAKEKTITSSLSNNEYRCFETGFVPDIAVFNVSNSDLSVNLHLSNEITSLSKSLFSSAEAVFFAVTISFDALDEFIMMSPYVEIELKKKIRRFEQIYCVCSANTSLKGLKTICEIFLTNENSSKINVTNEKRIL